MCFHLAEEGPFFLEPPPNQSMSYHENEKAIHSCNNNQPLRRCLTNDTKTNIKRNKKTIWLWIICFYATQIFLILFLSFIRWRYIIKFFLFYFFYYKHQRKWFENDSKLWTWIMLNVWKIRIFNPSLYTQRRIKRISRREAKFLSEINAFHVKSKLIKMVSCKNSATLLNLILIPC